MSLLQPPPVLMPPPSVFLNQPTKEDVDLVREVRGLFEKRKNEEQEQEQTQARTATAETPFRLYPPRNHDICIRSQVKTLLPPPRPCDIQVDTDADVSAALKVESLACEGWVHKRGDWRNPTFKRRWFVLKEHENPGQGWVLRYYKSLDDGDGSLLPQGSLSVAGMLVQRNAGRSGKMPCFAMTPAVENANGHHVRRILCACDSSEEHETWTTKLKKAAKIGEVYVKHSPEEVKGTSLHSVLYSCSTMGPLPQDLCLREAHTAQSNGMFTDRT